MLRIISFLFFATLCTNIGYAQEEELDSLEYLLSNKELNEETRLKVLNKTSFILREKDLQKAMAYGEEAAELAVKLGDSLELGHSKGNLGWINYRLGIWDKAFRYSRDSYLISSSQNDKHQVAMALNNLGAIYYQQTNYEEALKKFTEAYQLALEFDDPYPLIRTLNNIALNYSKMELYDAAIFYANRALEVNKQSGSKYFTSFTNRVIGDVLLAQDQIDEAISIFGHALEVASHQRLRSFESSIYHRLGKAYYLKGDYEKALEVLYLGKTLSEENGFQDELYQTYNILYRVYDSLGNVPKAYAYQKAFLVLDKKMDEKEAKDRLALIQGMFEVEKTDARVRYLTSENALQELKLKSNRSFILLIGIAAGLFALFLVWLYILNQRSKSINKNLVSKQNKVTQQKLELEKQSLELEKSNQTKNRLLSILGHDLKAPVVNLQSVLELMHEEELSREEFDKISHVLKRNVDSLYGTLDNILSWSRAQISGFKVKLHPLDLNDVIHPCIELVSLQANVKGIKFHTSIPQNLKVWLDKDLFQIVMRNLLTNAVKFSKKNSVISIVAKQKANKVYLQVIDKGIGIPLEKLKTIQMDNFSLVESSVGTANEQGTGLGLTICREFMDLLDGEFIVESERNKGTTITLALKVVNIISNVPIPEEKVIQG